MYSGSIGEVNSNRVTSSLRRKRTRLPTHAHEVRALTFEVTDNFGSNIVLPCGAYGPRSTISCRLSSFHDVPQASTANRWYDCFKKKCFASLFCVSQYASHWFTLISVSNAVNALSSLKISGRLAGLVVKAFASGAEDPGFESLFRVESYQ